MRSGPVVVSWGTVCTCTKENERGEALHMYLPDERVGGVGVGGAACLTVAEMLRVYTPLTLQGAWHPDDEARLPLGRGATPYYIGQTYAPLCVGTHGISLFSTTFSVVSVIFSYQVRRCMTPNKYR